jgi:deoxyribodipyrimidine photo-lyase
MLFTRDLRIRDNPALAAAVGEHGTVVPAFVFDDQLLGGDVLGTGRVGFLLECLDDLDESLRDLGAGLVVRRGDWVTETLRLAAAASARTIHLSDDLSPFARRRLDRLGAEAARVGVEVRRHPGVAVVPPRAVTPAGASYFQVFTPYFHRWITAPLRPVAATPRRIRGNETIPLGTLPFLRDLAAGQRCAPSLLGGEHAAHWRFAGWAERELDTYDRHRDDLAVEGTSRLSAYLHFGCISPLTVMKEVLHSRGGGAFLRQLCWRDFFYQVLAARPDAAWGDFRPRGDVWDESVELLDAWSEGRTGYPVVDAGMRQLRAEGFMPNRARMIVASFLTKDLFLDWRAGARHFMRWLLDADVASNNLNWQWVAGTGTDTSSHRILNPTLQGLKHDPDGRYVRRHVPELRGVPGRSIHDPDPVDRRSLGYPMPVVDHAQAVARYRARRVPTGTAAAATGR